MNVALLIDPIERLTLYKDSSVAMMEAFLKRHIQPDVFTEHDLFCQGDIPYAQMHQVTHIDVHKKDGVVRRAHGTRSLLEYDVILMRKDPPFDMEYIYATYALDLAALKGVWVVNRPQSLRDANEKCFTLQFPSLTPKTLVAKNMEKLRAFWEEERDVIFKPLNAMGGRSVFRVDSQGQNLGVVLEVLTQSGQVSIMAQRFIEDIYTHGDKRILLINGEPVPYALARIPAHGDMRGNLAAGAKGQVVPITERDRAICSTLGDTLRQKGLYFVGIDVIGDYLTEVNVTSPTCIREIEAVTGLDIAGQFVDFLIQTLSS